MVTVAGEASMDELLWDMYGHQAWADAEHWRALEAHRPALEDSAIRERLHHIHLVQHAFLHIVRREEPSMTSLQDFSRTDDHKEYALRYHKEIRPFLDGATPELLAEVHQIPWFKDPPIRITTRQALAQAAMHSHYHRGQNATRLRELGGETPLTDYIVWIWKGQPEPSW